VNTHTQGNGRRGVNVTVSQWVYNRYSEWSPSVSVNSLPRFRASARMVRQPDMSIVHLMACVARNVLAVYSPKL
jgi:hypothetical protein